MVLAHILSANSTSYSCPDNHHDHNRSDHQERLDLHPKDDARWPVIVDEGMLSRIPYRAGRIVARRLSYYRELVADRVDRVIVLESVGRRDLGGIVILIERGESLWWCLGLLIRILRRRASSHISIALESKTSIGGASRRSGHGIFHHRELGSTKIKKTRITAHIDRRPAHL